LNFDLKKGGIMKVNLTIGIPVWLDKIFTWPVLLYRLWKFGYTFRRICLGDGEWTILDAEDYYRFGNLKWCIAANKYTFYAVRFVKTERRQIKSVKLHREIMNAPAGLLVDHRNGDGLDNRRGNLRLATHSQNACNCRRNKSKTSSRFVGVNFKKRENCWCAQINYQGKAHWLGRFTSEADAARAYDTAARKYHGEFARLNFPESADSPSTSSG
jgi:hypothetical protein